MNGKAALVERERVSGHDAASTALNLSRLNLDRALEGDERNTWTILTVFEWQPFLFSLVLLCGLLYSCLTVLFEERGSGEMEVR